MTMTSNTAPRCGKALAGDARELARGLGSPEDLAAVGVAVTSAGAPAVVDVGTLREFLGAYVTSVLIPVELPLVYEGYGHASRGATRELIALDRAHVPMGLAGRLAEASQSVGRTHLRRMQPLRGERRVQRYWRAVQRGEARAWHTVVYGLVLAVYGLPLRPGLVSFGCETVRGFVNSTRKRLALDLSACAELEREHEALVGLAVDGLLAGRPGIRLLA
jgi:urease accessory protein UreF